LEDQIIISKQVLGGIQDTDMASALVELEQQKMQLQAMFMTQVSRPSLLDYMGKR
jgi:flagellin-like hook-associated protein FlgL